jgi:hypothetical protein
MYNRWIRRLLFIFFVICFIAAPGQAQQNESQEDDWVPHGMEALAQHSSFHTDFTFDKTMLDMANNFVDDEDWSFYIFEE